MTNDHPLPLTTEEVERRIAAAEKEVTALCRGVRKWRMTVPVEQDDSDIVFVNLIEAAQQLLAARSDRDELDVERLARAICGARPPELPPDYRDDMFVDDECHSLATRVVAEYRRLSSQGTT